MERFYSRLTRVKGSRVVASGVLDARMLRNATRAITSSIKGSATNSTGPTEISFCLFSPSQVCIAVFTTLACRMRFSHCPSNRHVQLRLSRLPVLSTLKTWFFLEEDGKIPGDAKSIDCVSLPSTLDDELECQLWQNSTEESPALHWIF